MFEKEEWEIIDAALTPDIKEVGNIVSAAVGNDTKYILIYMAMYKNTPSWLIEKHLLRFVSAVDFYDFMKSVRLSFAHLPKVPIHANTERMFYYNAVHELEQIISKMPVDEIHGLLDFLVTRRISISLGAFRALVMKLYEIELFPRRMLLLTLAAHCQP